MPASPGGSHLVEPSNDFSLIFYVDMAIDAELAICDESTFSIQKEAAIASFGNFSSPGRTLSDVGGSRLALPSSDMLVIFDHNAI